MSSRVAVHSARTNGLSSNVSTTSYLSLGQTRSIISTEATRKVTMRTPGVFSNLFVHVTANTITAATTMGFRNNAVDGNQSASITASTTGDFEDTTHTDVVASGDLPVYKITVGGTGTSVSYNTVMMLFVADTDTVSLLYACANPVSLSAASTTTFSSVGGQIDLGATAEGDDQIKARTAGTCKNLRALVSANARSTASTLRSRKNTANGAMSASITASTTGVFEDTSNTDAIATTDLMTVSLTTGTGTGATDFEQVGFDFVTTNNAQIAVSNMGNGGPTTVSAASTTNYSQFEQGGDPMANATESTQQQILRRVATAANSAIRVTTNARGTATTVALRVNGASSALSISCTASTAGTFEDTTHTVTIAAADLINYSITTGTGAGSFSYSLFTTVLTAVTSDVIFPVNRRPRMRALVVR